MRRVRDETPLLDASTDVASVDLVVILENMVLWLAVRLLDELSL